MSISSVNDLIKKPLGIISRRAQHWVGVQVERNRYRTTDVFVLGYPKTGNTWTRLLIGRYCQCLFKTEYTPLFDYYDRLGRCERAGGSPAMHFTHSPLEWNNQTEKELSFENVVKPFSGKKVVLIIRYPLDALVSSWFQAVYRAMEFNGELVSFLENPIWGLRKFMRYYNVWAGLNKSVRDLMLLRYEDLKKDTDHWFRSLLEFVGLEVDLKVMAEAIEFSSFENMRKMEERGPRLKYKSSGLDIFATGDKKNPNAFHVRRGKIGGYRDYLSAEDAIKYESQVVREMNSWYGYGERV